MLGGNPLGDRFGFRYWKNPGSFATLYGFEGHLGRFVGFLQCLIQASFTIAGPDYVSMAAGETENHTTCPNLGAFKAVFYRLTNVLYVRIAVCRHSRTLWRPIFDRGLQGRCSGSCGLPICCLHDSTSYQCFTGHCQRSGPHIGTLRWKLLLLLRQPKSVRNGPGKARHQNSWQSAQRNGVPIYCVLVVLIISLLAFLTSQQQRCCGPAVVRQLGKSINVSDFCLHLTVAGHCISAHQLLRHVLHLPQVQKSAWSHKASAATPSPTSLSGNHTAHTTPLSCAFIMTFVGGYTVFLPGFWDIPTFLFSYTMIGVFPTSCTLHGSSSTRPSGSRLPRQTSRRISMRWRSISENYVEMPPK